MIPAITLAAVFMLCLILAYRNGRQDKSTEIQEKNEDAGKKAAMVRDRVMHDRDYAERVQKRFTR